MQEELEIYFEEIQLDFKSKAGTFGEKWTIHNAKGGFPDLSRAEIAIIGVQEDRGATMNTGTAGAPDVIREQLYKLFPSGYMQSHKVVDLGNIRAGSTIDDTYYAVSDVISKLIKNNIFVITLGGSHDLTYANYLAYEKLEQTVNLVTIDRKFDLGDPV
ncbi:MAG: arginase family protein, partial [Flavobacteriales bacterium]|nr:arginase family protein [Flavobacteriales bacterium]